MYPLRIARALPAPCAPEPPMYPLRISRALPTPCAPEPPLGLRVERGLRVGTCRRTERRKQGGGVVAAQEGSFSRRMKDQPRAKGKPGMSRQPTTGSATSISRSTLSPCSDSEPEPISRSS